MSPQRTLAIASALALALGCDSSDGGPAPFEPGHSDEMVYRANGPNGLPALQGKLMVSSPRPAGGYVAGDEFSGAWTIDWVPIADRRQLVGPQVGTGNFVAHVEEGGLVSIALTPGQADSNVDLTATIVGDELVGTWNWTTIRGQAAAGAFRVR